MKSFVAFACFALFAVAVAAPLDPVENAKQQCIEEVNVSKSDAARIEKNDWAYPSSNLQCYLKCFYEKVGIFKDGVVQEDVVLEQLGAVVGEEKVKKILPICAPLKGKNDCDTAFVVFKCLSIYQRKDISEIVAPEPHVVPVEEKTVKNIAKKVWKTVFWSGANFN